MNAESDDRGDSVGATHGWSERRVRRTLGKPYGGSVRNGIRYNFGDSREGIGPLLWILTIRVDYETRRVVSASTDTEPY